MEKEKVYIDYDNQKYLLLFDFNVMEQIQEEYGTLDKWSKVTGGDGKEPNIKAVIFGIGAMINEGIYIENKNRKEEEKLKEMDHKDIGIMLSAIGMDELTSKLQKAVINATKTNEKN